MTFSNLGLSDNLISTIEEIGFKKPTAIQQQAIPYVLQGRDLFACAQTGTGKTGAFTLPIIEILIQTPGKARMPRAIILEPTRELALQVYDNLKIFMRNSSLKCGVFVGGEFLGAQEKILNRESLDVVVATPGRLLDLLERGMLLLKGIKVLVIDEADRMLDMGFIPEVNKIVTHLPPLRQTLFFSATMPKEIEDLAGKYLQNPKRIVVTPEKMTAESIEQWGIHVKKTENKNFVTQAILQQHAGVTGIIFCNRKKTVDELVRFLSSHSLKVEGLHGDMHQNSRNDTLKKFRAGEFTILVASDVAARGLDVDDLGIVINYDVPGHAEDYVHRIGRTGRGGRTGKAYTLIGRTDKKLLGLVEKYIQKPLPELKEEEFYQSIHTEEKPSEEKPSEKLAEKKEKPNRRKPKGNQQKVRPLPAEEAVSTEKTPEQSTATAPNLHNHAPRQNGKAREHKRQGREESIIGFGTEIPAFMKKPAKINSLSS